MNAARRFGGAAACALVVLAACVPVAPPTVSTSMAPPPPKPPTAADELVAYLARLRSLDEAGLSMEASRQREFARQDASDVNRLKMALALAANPQSEDADIVGLVEPLLKETPQTDADVRAMASFLHGMVVERRRLKEGAAAAGNRSRDDRRAYEAQKQRADKLQESNAQLQQKLDALTDLEKSLSNRKGK
jgi:hypothetical protein